MKFVKSLALSVCILLLGTLLFACGPEVQLSFFYFEDNVVNLHVNDTLDVWELSHVTMIDKEKLFLTTDNSNLEINGFVIFAKGKGTAFIYVCSGAERLARLQVNVYEENPSDPDGNDFIADDDKDNSQITYTCNYFKAAGYTYYSIDFFKGDATYGNFDFVVSNSNVDVHKSGNVLNVEWSGDLTFDIEIRDLGTYNSFILHFPLTKNT